MAASTPWDHEGDSTVVNSSRCSRSTSSSYFSMSGPRLRSLVEMTAAVLAAIASSRAPSSAKVARSSFGMLEFG